MKTEFTGTGTDERRLRRDRRLVIGSTFLVLAATVTYLFMVIAGTNSIRTRNALDRNSDTARLCARLLDEQCDSAVSVLQSLSERPQFEEQLRRRNRPPLEEYLNDAVEMVPDLLATAIYSVDGQRILAYPDQELPLGSAAAEPWFREVSQTQKLYIGNVVRLRKPQEAPQDALTIAIPIREKGHAGTAGYLLAYYRLRDIEDWLQRIRFTGGNVLIFDQKGTVIATGGALSKQTRWQVPRQMGNPLLRRALNGESGAQVADDPLGGQEKAVVGYAFAARPGWALLVTQSVGSAFASSDYLLRRLTLILGPLLLLLGGTGWVLVTFYHRQQALTRQLAERNETLFRQDRAKSDLLANVSHGLKTPIASMQLSVSGVLDSGPLVNANQTEECLSLVSQELDELEGRVRNLLDMSRLDAGTAPLWREPCDLTDIAAAALERLRPLLRDRPVEAAFPLEPLMVEVDQTQMETVLINLLENAVKYSPPGSTLHLRGESENEFAKLSIRDEGAGVAEEERERIFEKFYRASTLPRAGGTGLGLAICRTVVEAHGGTITVVTPQSGGAEFQVCLPRIPEETL
jgi:signal transduction histidine kinase